MRIFVLYWLLLVLAVVLDGNSAVADFPGYGLGPRLRFSSGSYAGPAEPPASSYTGACSTLADIAAMPPGTWCEIADSDLRPVAPSPLPPGGANRPAQVVGAWSGAGFDAVGNCLYILGGGHSDYAGNEVYTFCLGTMGVARPWGPTPNEDIPTELIKYVDYLDGNPSSKHTYNGIIPVPTADALMTYSGGPWNDNGFLPNVWKFDLTAQTWTQLQNIPDDGGGDSGGSITAIYYPPLDRVITFDTNSTVMLHNVATDTWTDTGTAYGGTRAYDHTPAWDEDDDVIVLVGFNSIYTYDPNADTMAFPTTTNCTTAAAPPPQGGGPGAAYDPSSGNVLIYQGGNGQTSVWSYDVATATCTELTVSGSNLATPTVRADYATGYHGTYGRWRYMPSVDRFINIEDFDDNFYVYRSPASQSASQTVVQTLTIEATTSGQVPFTTTVSLEDGAVADKPSLAGLEDSQAACLSEYPSGDCRIAVVSGIVSLTADTPLDVEVYDQPATEGTALTASDISAAVDSDTASMQFGSEGTINLNTIKSTGLIETVYSGPVMVEAVYGDTITAGTGEKLIAKFFVRLYSDGRMRVRVAAYNGGLQTTISGSDDVINYVPTITIDGSTVYNNGGSSLEHPNMSGYNAVAWIGGDPGVSVVPDMAQLRATNAVANYVDVTPTDAQLDGQDQTYDPMDIADFSPAMGGAGYSPWIGLLTNASTLVITSNGDSRAIDAATTEAESTYSFPIAFLDETTLKPPVISDFGTWTVYGDAGGGASVWSTDTGTKAYDIPHHPHAAYVPFLLTADPYYLEIMQAQAVACFLGTADAHGTGVTRRMYGQNRGIGWCIDSIAQVVSVSDAADSIASDLQDWLDWNITTWNGSGCYEYFCSVNTTDISPLGILFEYTGGTQDELPGGLIGAFQDDFWISALVFARQLKVLPDNDDMDDVVAYKSKMISGRLGPNGTDNFCYTKASKFDLDISTDGKRTPLVSPSGSWFGGTSAWGDVYEKTFGVPNTSCGDTLRGTSGGAPWRPDPGYWVQILAPAAQLADMETEGVPGVTDIIAGLARVAGASNGGDPYDYTCDHAPIFCIEPK